MLYELTQYVLQLNGPCSLFTQHGCDFTATKRGYFPFYCIHACFCCRRSLAVKVDWLGKHCAALCCMLVVHTTMGYTRCREACCAVQPPGLDQDYGMDAASYLAELTGAGKRLTAVVESKEKAVGKAKDPSQVSPGTYLQFSACGHVS